jgi:cobyrinic acid a,c-diamide synthase
MIQGYRQFLPNTLGGVLFSRIPEKAYARCRRIVEDRLRLPVYGYLPLMPETAFASRHLGLITPHGIEDVQARLDRLADACEAGVDVDGLLRLGRSAPPLDYEPARVERIAPGLPVAVARDAAFCFYYEDSLDLLRRLGMEPVFFSPLADSGLPEQCCGLILGGGYPEEYARALSRNTSMLRGIAAAAAGRMPILAECGGYMYLCEEVLDREGARHPLAGVVPARAYMTDRLRRFGYVRLRAEKDTLLCRRGDELRAHEFHYSDSSDNGAACTGTRSDGTSRPCIHAHDRLFAGYAHIHLGGNPDAAEAFVRQCLAYREETRGLRQARSG